MFTRINQRLKSEDRGFTLIELMVVVLIIAILIAIAVPTFLGARKRAQDKQAQSNIRNGLTTEKTYYVDNQAYTAVAASLTAVETSLDFTTNVAKNRGVLPTLGNAGADDQTVVLQSVSASGTTFCLADIATGASAGTYYTKACAGGETAAVIAAGWNKSTDGWA